MRRCHEVDYEIRGESMQLVEVELDPGETVIAEAGAMTYMEEGIQFEARMGDGSQPESGFFGALMGAGKRMLTGESLFMTHFTNQGHGKRRVAFSAPYPGTLLALDMAELGGELILQKDSFLAAALGTQITMTFNKRLGTGFFGGEGFIMQKLKGDGMAFVHAGGTLIKKELRGRHCGWIPVVWWALPPASITTFSAQARLNPWCLAVKVCFWPRCKVMAPYGCKACRFRAWLTALLPMRPRPVVPAVVKVRCLAVLAACWMVIDTLERRNKKGAGWLPFYVGVIGKLSILLVDNIDNFAGFIVDLKQRIIDADGHSAIDTDWAHPHATVIDVQIQNIAAAILFLPAGRQWLALGNLLLQPWRQVLSI